MLRRRCSSGGESPQPSPGRDCVASTSCGQLRDRSPGRTSCGLSCAGGHERRVANLLGAEPPHVEPPEQVVRRIDGQRPLVAGGRHLVGARGHDQPVQRLELPVVVDQPQREPIEQLGMRRRRAQLAEVVGRADDAAAEVMLPDAVDDHPRGEHVLAARRSTRPARGGGRPSGRLRRRAESRRRVAEQRGKMRLDLVARHVRIAADA